MTRVHIRVSSLTSVNPQRTAPSLTDFTLEANPQPSEQPAKGTEVPALKQLAALDLTSPSKLPRAGHSWGRHRPKPNSPQGPAVHSAAQSTQHCCSAHCFPRRSRQDDSALVLGTAICPVLLRVRMGSGACCRQTELNLPRWGTAEPPFRVEGWARGPEGLLDRAARFSKVKTQDTQVNLKSLV